jgi:hypothetical protein
MSTLKATSGFRGIDQQGILNCFTRFNPFVILKYETLERLPEGQMRSGIIEVRAIIITLDAGALAAEFDRTNPDILKLHGNH